MPGLRRVRVGPVVLAGHVVEHEVEHEARSRGVEVLGERLEVVHGAQVGPHRAVVGHGVATVVVALARAQQRHEVEVGDAELAQVGQVLGDPAQVAGEPLGVRGVAHHLGVLEPVGPQEALEVAQVEAVGPYAVRRRGQPHEVGGEQRCPLGPVEGRQPADEVGPPALDTRAQHDLPLLARAGGHRDRGRGHRCSHGPHSRRSAQAFPQDHGTHRRRARRAQSDAPQVGAMTTSTTTTERVVSTLHTPARRRPGGRITFDPTGLVKGWAVAAAAAHLDVVPEIAWSSGPAGTSSWGPGAASGRTRRSGGSASRTPAATAGSPTS